MTEAPGSPGEETGFALLAVADLAGTLLLSACPGGGATGRDLEADLDAIARKGAGTLVTLMEERELRPLGLSSRQIHAACDARGVAWVHLPIRDMEVPDSGFEHGWVELGTDLRRQLALGRIVAIHCRAGLGRTGTVAARLLIELGLTPAAAIRTVRAARPGAIETQAQEAYLARLRPIGEAS